MKIGKVYNALKDQFSKKKYTLEKNKLLGCEIITLPGTVREKVDKDDAWFYQLAKNAKFIFDIGANVGYSALLANLSGNVKRMVLVDANPEALADAARNLLINNLVSVCNFYPAFVGKEDLKKVKFYTVGSGAAGSMFKSHSETASVLNSFIEVDTITVDSLVKFYGFEPDFVKIDVEGAESLALQGASGLAEKKLTQFLVEMHSLLELPMAQNAKKVLDWCHRYQYRAWYLKEGKILSNPEYIAHRGKCHLLLQPAQWEYPLFLRGIKQSAPLPESI